MRSADSFSAVRSERKRLAILLGGTLFAVTVLIAFLVWSGYREAITGAEVASNNYAEIIEARLEATFRRAEAHVQELARNLPLAAMNKQAVAHYAPGIDAGLDMRRLNFPELVGLRVFDVEGDLIYTSESRTTPRVNAVDRDYFRAARQNKGDAVFFSEVVVSRITGRPAMFVARAVRDSQGVFRGVAMASVELEYFQQLFRSLNIGVQGVIGIHRSDDFSLIARWPVLPDMYKMRMPEGHPARTIISQGGIEATFSFSGIDNITRIYGIQRLENYPFFVIAGIGMNDALAGWRMRSLAIGGAGMLLMLLLTALFVRLQRTEMHEAQAIIALEESEHRHRDLIASMPGAAYEFCIDSTGRRSIPFISAGITEISGLLPEQIVADVNLAFARIPATELPALEQSIAESMKNLTPWLHEVPQIATNGELKWIRGHSIPRREADGSTLWRGVFIDISELKRHEAALQSSEIQLTGILESTADGILAVDEKGKVIRANTRFAEMWGIPVTLMQSGDDKAMLRYVLDQLVDPQAFVDKVLALYASSDEDMDTLMFKDGKYFERYSSPLILHGALYGRVWSFRDVTQLKQAEARRMALEAQLRESQKMEAIGTLAGGIAHDFNNILAAINGNAELAREDVGVDHPARASLDAIGKAGRRAREMVNQILAFSRQQPQTRQPVSLSAVVEEAVKLMRVTLPAGIELVVSADADAPGVLANSTQMHQVVMNLCTNAWHALVDNRGRIEIRIEAATLDDASGVALPPGHYLHLSVKDDGRGMDAATQARVLEPFFTTKPVGSGTGLGLSVVHGIVQTHEGAIRIDSAPGGGTTVHLYFPAVALPAQIEVPASSRSDKTAPRGEGKCVLYLDDEEDLVQLVKNLLERQGYTVHGYTVAETAMQALRRNPQGFDLVVTDFNMPGLSGLDVARAVARIRADLPVAITSGYITDALRHDAAQAGVKHVLYKANTVEELCETVGHLIDQV